MPVRWRPSWPSSTKPERNGSANCAGTVQINDGTPPDHNACLLLKATGEDC